MLPLIVGGLAAGAEVASGLIGSSAQDSANQANRLEAERNRAFQERMSSSAHQREVEDLRKAGLNPVLSARGGASTPGGAMATANPVVNDVGAALGKGLSSAQAAASLEKDLKQKDASIDATRAQESAARAQARQAVASAKNQESTNKAVDAQAGVDAARAEVEKGMVKYDAISKRVLEGIGGVVDAANVKRLLMGSPGPREREHKLLEKRGAKGINVLPRRLK